MGGLGCQSTVTLMAVSCCHRPSGVDPPSDCEGSAKKASVPRLECFACTAVQAVQFIPFLIKLSLIPQYQTQQAVGRINQTAQCTFRMFRATLLLYDVCSLLLSSL